LIARHISSYLQHELPFAAAWCFLATQPCAAHRAGPPGIGTTVLPAPNASSNGEPCPRSPPLPEAEAEARLPRRDPTLRRPEDLRNNPHACPWSSRAPSSPTAAAGTTTCLFDTVLT
jgi:hypothetical protein